jgi:hypothetical protein
MACLAVNLLLFPHSDSNVYDDKVSDDSFKGETIHEAGTLQMTAALLAITNSKHVDLPVITVAGLFDSGYAMSNTVLILSHNKAQLLGRL